MRHQTRGNNRILLVIDIEWITDDDALRLCRPRIHEAVDAIRANGYTAHAVRIDINGYPHLRP